MRERFDAPLFTSRLQDALGRFHRFRVQSLCMKAPFVSETFDMDSDLSQNATRTGDKTVVLCASAEEAVAVRPKRKTFILFRPFTACQRFIRFLYDWVLSWAHSRFGTIALAVLAFTESSFFPIPPDVLQLALSVERPKRSFYYAAVSAISSVCGAALGWYIGYALWEAVGPVFVPAIISEANMARVAAFFSKWGFSALFIAAFTPIPFKAFTISSGIGGMALPLVLFASLIGRSARFFLMATLVFCLGPRVGKWIDKYFGWLTIALLVLFFGGIYGIKFFI
jgi:membrane protein YqaA with SNARE-associated domain